MQVHVKGLVKDTDRHGNDRWYFRAPGRKKVRLREPVGSDAFQEELRCARLGLSYRKGEAAPAPSGPAARPGSLKWLTLEYLRRGCVNLAATTITKKRQALEALCDTPVKEGATTTYGQMPAHLFAAIDAERLRDLRAQIPNGANFWLKQLSCVFDFGMRTKDAAGRPLATGNPTLGVTRFRIDSDGHHTWTIPEIRAFRERHRPGSQADLAFTLFFFVPARVCDIAGLGRQNRYERPVADADGNVTMQKRIRFKPRKTSHSSSVEVDIAEAPELTAVLEALPKTQMIFLQSNKGRAYSDKSLSNMMCDWCDQANIPHCTAHGLRKAYSTIVAENGGTSHQLMAALGWTRLETAEIYTRAAERRRLADETTKHLKLV